MKKVPLVIISLFLSNCIFLSCSNAFATKNCLEDDSVMSLESKTDCDYLFMLYLDGDNSLSDAIFYNLMQCEYGLFLHNQRFPDVNMKILVLWDGKRVFRDGNQYPQTSLYEIGERNTKPEINKNQISSNTKELTFYAGKWMHVDKKNGFFEVNMGDPDTLTGFLEYANNHYNPKNTVLLLANHGGGPFSYTDVGAIESNRLICTDDSSAQGDTYRGAALDTNKIAPSIKKGWNNKLDIIMYDACYCGTVECLYELKEICDYVIASPNAIPYYGYPYDIIIENNFYKHQSMEEIAINTVREYASFYKNKLIEENSSFTNNESSSPTLSAYRVDVKSMTALKKAIDSFAMTIMNDDNKKLKNQAIMHMFNSGYLYPMNRSGSSLTKDDRELKLDDVQCLWYKSTYFPLFDLGFLADKYYYNVENESSDIKNKSYDLQNALNKIILYSWRGDCKQTKEELQEEVNKGLYPKLYNNNGLNYYGLGICGSIIETNGINKVKPFNTQIYQRSSSFGKESEWGKLLTVLFPPK